MAKDYSRSERYIRETTSRIDKDLKVELRETAFNMWMGCYSQQEIADEVGYTQKAISEFLESLQAIPNGTDAENSNLSENPELTNDSENREFDDDEQDDSNSLGVYKLDKRLLIKSPAFRVYQPTRARTRGYLWRLHNATARANRNPCRPRYVSPHAPLVCGYSLPSDPVEVVHCTTTPFSTMPLRVAAGQP